jgi:hypothetical protein
MLVLGLRTLQLIALQILARPSDAPPSQVGLLPLSGIPRFAEGFQLRRFFAPKLRLPLDHREARGFGARAIGSLRCGGSIVARRLFPRPLHRPPLRLVALTAVRALGLCGAGEAGAAGGEPRAINWFSAATRSKASVAERMRY